MSLHVRNYSVLRGVNTYNAEDMNVLVTMSKCLQRCDKECDVAASDLKAVLEDQLLKDLTIRYVESVPNPSIMTYVKEVLIYDLCGFMIHARPNLTECEL